MKYIIELCESASEVEKFGILQNSTWRAHGPMVRAMACVLGEDPPPPPPNTHPLFSPQKPT